MAVDASSSAPTGGTSSTAAPPQPPPRRAAAPPPGLPMPSANPLPLSASQEAQVRDLYYERVRQHCQDEIKAFAACALGRTFSVVFACRDRHTAMNACLKQHATPQALDSAREEWFARRAERAAERQRKAARKLEQEQLLREWWGLENQDGTAGDGSREDIQAKRRRREAEQMRRPERVGGFPAKDRPRFDDDAAGTADESATKR